jgi:phage gp36-like protein
MAYSTKADILLQLPEDSLITLTDDENTGAVVDEVVTRAIADADAEIDGYVGTRHTVPLSPVPTVIRLASVRMAIYHLHARRSLVSVPDQVKTDYDNQVRLLRDISKGVVSLGADDPGGTPPQNNRPVVSSTNPEKQLTRTKLERF